MKRTKESRDSRRRQLYANELKSLQQAETHWKKASNAWEAKDELDAMVRQCRTREAECRSQRCRSQLDYLDFEEEVVVPSGQSRRALERERSVLGEPSIETDEELE